MKKIILITFLIILIPIISYARIKTPNLVAGFAFEGNGNDWSGNSWNGTVTGATLANGKFGQAYNFDGVGDDINVGDINATDGIAQLTVSAWVKMNSTTGTTKSIVSKFDGNTGWILETGTTGTFALVAMGGNIYAQTGAILDSTTWHHWAMVFDGNGSTNADKMKFYFDGVNQSLTFQGTMPATTPNSALAVIIGDNTEGSRDIDAILDEIRIFNRALTAGEIRALMLNFDPYE